MSGEEAKSFGYGGTGKAATECKFEDYGQQFTAGDVITAYLVSALSFQGSSSNGSCDKGIE